MLGMSSNVWSTPWPYSGMGIALLVLTVGLFRMLRARRLARERSERSEPSTMLVLGSKRKADTDGQEDFVTFGDFGQPVPKE